MCVCVREKESANGRKIKVAQEKYKPITLSTNASDIFPHALLSSLTATIPIL